MYEPSVLHEYIQEQTIAEKLSAAFNERVTIDPSTAECLKSTKRSSIYKLLVQTKAEKIPVILKIYTIGKYKNQVEINMYSKAAPFLTEFLPQIYHIETRTSQNEIWIFMEFVHQIRGRLTFTPRHFDYIIPGIAALHAHTFEDKFISLSEQLQPWFPVYDSKTMRKERLKYTGDTVQWLDQAVQDSRLQDIVNPHYTSLMKIYEKQPDFFPELLESGSSITHGDLHMQNICCKTITENQPWNIQLIDWESTKFAPSWFDMIVLVELLIAFRKDWQSNAEEIRTHCAALYTKEMNKHGIEFKTPSLTLYKMAYLQRTLEKGLHTQLRRFFTNRGGELLPYHLEKTATWGKELGIYH